MTGLYHSKDINDINPTERVEIELLLEGLNKLYGYDFRDYVFSSIRRRIWYRIRAEGLKTVSGLQEKIFYDSACLNRLLTDFSIQVTEMFRDPDFFIAFRQKVIPVLRELPQIRIWHAGCSTGQEVYSMVILFHEEGLDHKTIYYATDFNSEALEKSKRGLYHLKDMKLYTQNYLQAGGKNSFSKYYTVVGENAVLHNFLKKNIVFAQHNLVTDGSINEFNVIFCRNVMIYFNKNLQNRVHELFFNSLGPHSFLALGKKETISYMNYANSYNVIDSEQKIYQKRS